MSEFKTHNDHSYSQITDQVYLGYNMRCCSSHFETLLALGISMDVNVEGENEEDPTGMSIHLWLPTPEHKVPSPAQLLVGAQAIQAAVQKGETVYVHCEKGHARSVVVVGAYLITTGMTTDNAIAMIKLHRDVIHPGEEHVSALRELESSLAC